MNREDYEEPACPMINPQTGERLCSVSLPMQRIIDKLEEYCTLKDFTGARRHLEYWLSEAEANGDLRGQFSMRNEMMGFFRKQGDYDRAVESVNEAIRLMNLLGNEITISGATCHVNCGTVYDTFNEPGNALRHFRKAEEIFEKTDFRDLFRIGSLYNNMALALEDLGRFSEAMDYYSRAMDTMRALEGTEPEQAITYLNMADCMAVKKGLDSAAAEIDGYLKLAKELLDSESIPRDGYYAFVCEKCSPGYNCYGWFDYAEELEKRAAEIYADAKSE